MTTDSEKIEIAKKFLAGLRTADRSLHESIMAENVVWNMPGDSLISGNARGIEAVHQRAVAIVGWGMQFELKHERNRRMKLKGTMVLVLLAWGLSASAQMVMDSSAALDTKKIKLFAGIDQAAEAAAVGLTLRPTILLIFGDPSIGTPMMEDYPGLVIDLPLKALVREAGTSEVFIGLTSPELLQKRHGLPSAPFTEVVGLFKALINAGYQP